MPEDDVKKTTEPEVKPEKTPEPDKAKGKAKLDSDESKAATEALQKQLNDLTKQLESYKAKEKEEDDKKKSSEQKLAEKEAELARIKRENLIVKLGAKKGLDPDLFDRVKGETDTEIETDIDLLLEKFKPAKGEETPETKGKKTQPAKTDTDPKKEDEEPVYGKKTADYMAWRTQKLKRG